MASKPKKDSGYRKNFSLIVAFIVLISVLFVLSLVFAYNFSKKNTENEFVSAKANVLEEVNKPFQDFFLNKIPQISYYNGFLDSATASRYIKTIIKEYPFVNRAVFYDIEVRNTRIDKAGLNVGSFAVGIKSVHQFGRNVPADSICLYDGDTQRNYPDFEDFSALSLKLISFVQKLDTANQPNQDRIFADFSHIRSKHIDYLNIPAMPDLKVYKQMMIGKLKSEPVYQQDMFSFELNPYKLLMANTHPLLYQSIRIEPATYDPISFNADYLTGEITLGGPMSDYKLFFISSKSFIKTKILSYFLPIASIITLFYGLVALVAFLIYRNLNINHKMFKLQYDFITNLTHEFKTPVSVIKIAGNNIKSAQELSKKEQLMYGKILDEEANKLNGLMNKLLAFTQIENKSISLNRDEVNLSDFVESTVEAHLLKHPNFELTFEIVGLTHFVTDPVLLGSLFDNLIENAYKYSPAHHKKLHISIRRLKDAAEFKFKDEGIGIPASEIPHIFKKFYRVQNQYNQNGSVGLGLAFCKELVNFMGGDITVSSTVGKGSQFKIVLPMA